MNFQEAEEYLLSLGNEVSSMKLGLENVSELFAELGHPQKNYLKVQVAGTNGKGSVCAFLNSICLTAGIRTGMYTSPHLISITERVQIDAMQISEREFARHATRVRDASESLVERGELENVPTFFEQVTAIALVAFAEANVGLAILETGLGGRLDATTAANAEIAAITRIDIDHQKYLGETIEEIAGEKAAIIREGSKVVIGDQAEKAMEVILARCRMVGVELRLAGGANDGRNPTPRLGLEGTHQIENAKVAAELAELLSDRFSITDRQIVKGLKAARHPGRLERIGRYLLDGAHNIGGAHALKEYLDECVAGHITMIFGAMEDKDVKEVGKILFPRADRLVLTRPSNSRALAAKDLHDAVPESFDRARVFVTDCTAEAMAKAEEISGTGDTIVVTGSLYLVGEARGILTANVR